MLNAQAIDDIRCPKILNNAFTRYWKIIDSFNFRKLPIKKQKPKKQEKFKNRFLGFLDVLNVQIEEDCTEDIIPKFGDNEECKKI